LHGPILAARVAIACSKDDIRIAAGIDDHARIHDTSTGLRVDKRALDSLTVHNHAQHKRVIENLYLRVGEKSIRRFAPTMRVMAVRPRAPVALRFRDPVRLCHDRSKPFGKAEHRLFRAIGYAFAGKIETADGS